MKSNKLSLKSLKVESFITSVEQEATALKGGTAGKPSHQTIVLCSDTYHPCTGLTCLGESPVGN